MVFIDVGSKVELLHIESRKQRVARLQTQLLQARPQPSRMVPELGSVAYNMV